MGLLAFTYRAHADEKKDWKLVWSDEFDKAGAPDPKKWDYEVGFVRNGELQYYSKDRRENARVEEGHLVIEGRKERLPEAGDKKSPMGDFSAASLTTRNIQDWTYGKFEIRAKIPTGRGTWPAIWLLGSRISQVGWPTCGEIDIMENVGYDPEKIHSTIHCKAYYHGQGTQKGGSVSLASPWSDFHVYACDWGPKRIVFFVDGDEIFRFDKEADDEDVWPFDNPHFLILNFAIGGGWGGVKGVDESVYPQKYLIDYVRIYQKP